jgi:hypothetical protein
MRETRLLAMKRGHHGKDRPAVLDRFHAARRKAAAVADAIDLIDDRYLRIAGQNEVGVQRMDKTGLDRACRRDERLADHLSAEDALPADLRAHAAIEVHFQPFEVENFNQGLNGIGHAKSSGGPVERCELRPETRPVKAGGFMGIGRAPALE